MRSEVDRQGEVRNSWISSGDERGVRKTRGLVKACRGGRSEAAGDGCYSSGRTTGNKF